MTLLKYILCSTLITLALSTAIPLKDFKQCQQRYDQRIGELVASEGMSSAKSLWRMLFNSLDLNQNHLLSSSEIVLKLDTDNIISLRERPELLQQIQSWINAAKAQDGDQELSLNEFSGIVSETIGRVETKFSNDRNTWKEAASIMCAYIDQHVPRITESLRSLYNCSINLKREQLQSIGDGEKRLFLNTWKGVFSTIDQNRDEIITKQEILETYEFFNANVSNNEVTDYLKEFMSGSNFSHTELFQAINKLLFSSNSNEAWENVTSFGQLKGKQILCLVLRDTRNNIITQLKKNENCMDAYKQTLNKNLGEDGNISSSYVFTIIDANKDGSVTTLEIDSITQSNSFTKILYDISSVSHSFNADNFTRFLPDKVVIERKLSTENTFELSVLSCEQHTAWNDFCLNTIRIINTFPSSVDEKPNVNLQNSIEKLHKQLQDPAVEITKEIIQSLKELVSAVDTTTSSMTNAVEITMPEILTSSPLLTATASSDMKLDMLNSSLSTSSPTSTSATGKEIPSQVISEFIESVEDGNITTSNSTINRELFTIMNQTNATTSKPDNESSVDKVLSKEEEELYELLLNVGRDKILKERKSGEDNRNESDSKTSEELELQELLKKAILQVVR